MTKTKLPRSAISPALVIGGLVVLGAVGWWVAQKRGEEQSRRAHRSTYARGTLKSIAIAQHLFREGDKEGDGTIDYGTLAEIIAAGLLGHQIPTSYGYLLESGPGQADPSFTWWARATPGPTLEGQYSSYFTNHKGLTWFTTTGEAAPITSLAAPPTGWRVVGR